MNITITEDQANEIEGAVSAQIVRFDQSKFKERADTLREVNKIIREALSKN